jgi:hypothetical protein
VTHSNLVSAFSHEHATFYWTVTLQVIQRLAEGRPIRPE